MSDLDPLDTPTEVPAETVAAPTTEAPPVRSRDRWPWLLAALALTAGLAWLQPWWDGADQPVAERPILVDERRDGLFAPLPAPGPSAPVAAPAPQREKSAPADAKVDTAYLVVPEPAPQPGPRTEEQRRQLAAQSAAAPAQPVEVPESTPFSEGEVALRVGGKPKMVASQESGRLGGVPGGVPGGIPGGLLAPMAPPPPMAPPNGQPYGEMYFSSAGTNPFVDAEDDHLSTFGLDVDTASYTVARRYLRDGNLPPGEAVRVEEFVNYFDYRDAPPRDGSDFALYAEGAPSPFAESERYHLLRFALRGRDIAAEDRAPATLIFVVDVSGSMDMENRLGLVRRSLGLLVDQLRADDRVGLVVYGSRGEVRLEPTGDRELIRREIDRLVPEGSTNVGEGLELAYELASRYRRPRTINRLILCSDGVANTGTTEAQAILYRAERYTHEGIELTTVGFGMGNYNDVLMETLADRGNGRYAYVDDLEEARRIFVESLTGTLQTLAAEARVQVDFDPTAVKSWRLLGYENRDIADERFRDDTVDAGEIGAGHAVTALYEIKTHREPAAGDRLATFTVRYASVAAGKMVEQHREIRGRDLAASWDAAPPAFRLAGVVAELAEVLKGSYWARRADMGQLFRRSQHLAAELEGRPELAELAAMIGKADELRRRSEEAQPSR